MPGFNAYTILKAYRDLLRQQNDTAWHRFKLIETLDESDLDLNTAKGTTFPLILLSHTAPEVTSNDATGNESIHLDLHVAIIAQESASHRGHIAEVLADHEELVRVYLQSNHPLAAQAHLLTHHWTKTSTPQSLVKGAEGWPVHSIVTTFKLWCQNNNQP